MTSENNSQNVQPVTQAERAPAAQANAATGATRESPATDYRIVSVTPTPEPQTLAPQEPEHPDLHSVQTNKGIEYYRKPENRPVFERLVREVLNEQPDINPAPDQFVSRKQYEIDKAVARHGLSDDDAAMLAKSDISVIPDLAARLAPAKAEGGNNVKPTAEAKPETPQVPTPPNNGKNPPPELGTADLLTQAATAFKDAYGNKG